MPSFPCCRLTRRPVGAGLEVDGPVGRRQPATPFPGFPPAHAGRLGPPPSGRRRGRTGPLQRRSALRRHPAKCRRRRRSKGFPDFPKGIGARVPKAPDAHIVMDNHATATPHTEPPPSGHGRRGGRTGMSISRRPRPPGSTRSGAGSPNRRANTRGVAPVPPQGKNPKPFRLTNSYPGTKEPHLTQVLKGHVERVADLRHRVLGIWASESVQKMTNLSIDGLIDGRYPDIVYGWNKDEIGIQLIFEFKKLDHPTGSQRQYHSENGLRVSSPAYVVRVNISK